MSSPRTNDHILTTNLQGVFGRGVAGMSLGDAVELLDADPSLTLPFRLSDLVPVYEQHLVLKFVVKPTPKDSLYTKLLENTGEFLLLTDPMFKAKRSLFVAKVIEYGISDENWQSQVSDLISGMGLPGLHVGHRNDDVFIAAPLYAFV